MEKIILFSTLSFFFGVIVSFLFFYKKNEKLKSELFELEVKEANNRSKIELLDEYKKEKDEILNTVKNEFANLAGAALIEKNKILQDENKASLEVFLSPLREKIKEFQQKVENANETSKLNAATIKEKIEDLLKETKITHLAAENLAQAISKNSKSRGLLGEIILEKLLKSSGLIDKKDNFEKGNYEIQKSFYSKETLTHKIVDAIIYLPASNKCVIIDSKAPLAEFLNFIETDNKDCLNNFYKDVQDRINELSGKYDNFEGLILPDFTIMFIPFENPLSYIYSNNKLVEYALSKNIVIAGPSTLIAALRIINYCWSRKNQYENMKDITKHALSIYEKAIILIQRLEEIDTSFEGVKKKFENALKTLKGQGGLIFQVEKLKDFGLSPAKNIEQKYLSENIN